MTKIMTSIIAFDLIKSGDLKLDEKFIISEKAWRYQHQVTHQCLLWWVMKFL
jgi:D-alanyl-D-alanine carboxypeptidase